MIKNVHNNVLIVGGNDFIEKLKVFAQASSYSKSPILISGETGTGKTLISKYIYNFVNNNNSCFLPLPLSELPENLFESQLFGYTKGSFTTAVSSFSGIIAEAHGGTILLEEIDCLPLSLQPKILRLIENGQYQRLGSTALMKADIRFMATTNKCLKTLVEEGHFRNDLYYRLNVLSFHIPPLRERINDLPKLVNAIENKLSNTYKRMVLTISDEAMQMLQTYNWPGNIRELNAVLERLYAFVPRAQNSIEAHNLIDTFNAEAIRLSKILTQDVERLNNIKDTQRIINALKRNNLNKSQTAKELGVSRNHLYFLLKKHGINE